MIWEGARDHDIDEPRVAVLWLRDAAVLALALVNAVLWVGLIYVVLP
jgi:hypothetical protein